MNEHDQLLRNARRGRDALLLADFEYRYAKAAGETWWTFEKKSQDTSDVPVGTLVFEASKKGDSGFTSIHHVGIVTKVMGRNLIITQHTKNVTEPLWAAAGKASWFNHGAVEAWAFTPQSWAFKEHTPHCDDYVTCQPGTP